VYEVLAKAIAAKYAEGSRCAFLLNPPTDFVWATAVLPTDQRADMHFMQLIDEKQHHKHIRIA